MTTQAQEARELSLERREVPCICPRQHEKAPPIGEPTDIRFVRGIAVERVRCSDAGCRRTWTRVNV